MERDPERLGRHTMRPVVRVRGPAAAPVVAVPDDDEAPSAPLEKKTFKSFFQGSVKSRGYRAPLTLIDSSFELPRKGWLPRAFLGNPSKQGT